MAHICISNLTIIGSDNGLLCGRHQALSKPMLEYCESDPSVKFWLKFVYWHPRNCIWKGHQQNGGHFVSASMCWGAPARLTHWGRVTHIYVGKPTIIGSDNGLSPGQRQAIIWNNAGLLLIEPSGTNFSEISIVIQTFSFKKIHLNMSSAKWRPFCLGLNVLIKQSGWGL